MKFGIQKKSFDLIINTLSRFSDIERAAIFGSRAIGNYKNGSDIDLVVYGDSIKPGLVNTLSVILNEELPIPYYFDIVHYESLDHKSLKKHIDEYGVIFWNSSTKS